MNTIGDLEVGTAKLNKGIGVVEALEHMLEEARKGKVHFLIFSAVETTAENEGIAHSGMATKQGVQVGEDQIIATLNGLAMSILNFITFAKTEGSAN